MPVILKEAEQAIIEMSKSYHSKQFPQTKDFVISIKTMLQEESQVVHKDLIL